MKRLAIGTLVPPNNSLQLTTPVSRFQPASRLPSSTNPLLTYSGGRCS